MKVPLVGIGGGYLYSYFLLLHLGPLPGTMHFNLKMEAARSSKNNGILLQHYRASWPRK